MTTSRLSALAIYKGLLRMQKMDDKERALAEYLNHLGAEFGLSVDDDQQIQAMIEDIMLKPVPPGVSVTLWFSIRVAELAVCSYAAGRESIMERMAKGGAA
jgi:hypothetical protein